MRSAGRTLGTILAAMVVGCGDGENGNGPAQSIALTATPSSLTLEQGTSGTVTVNLVRGGGFDGAVTVTVTGLPTGVTLSVVPSPLTGTTTSATVTVNVGASVPAGVYTATVNASAAGIGSATATYTLTVTATPNYALAANPAAVSIGQGTSAQTTINVQRTNFTGAVTLSLDNPPSGITGAFNANPATADQSTLTIDVALSVPTGNYNLTVKGAATGPGDKSTSVALTVTEQPDYTLSTTPNAVTINAGSDEQTTVNIARTNFTGAVTLSLDTPPEGVTATFNPAAPTGNSSVATITVAASVIAGNYDLTIKGTATGVPALVDSVGASTQVAAIGDRTTTVALTVAPTPSFTISANPAALNVSQGGSGNSTVSVVRTNLTTDIALTLVNPPAGITGGFTPPTLGGATMSSTLAIDVAGNVAPGVYPVTVQGAAGTLTRSTVIDVNVVSGPTVSLVANPALLTIEQGSSGQSTLTATRTNYTGDIVPSASGNPGGMAVTFNPDPLTADMSTITVAVGGGVAPGQYNLTITGASGAAGNPTTPLQVTVTAPSGSNIVWEFCNTDDVPIQFWRQSSGTWAAVAPTVVGNVTRFAFTVSSSTGGVAYTISTAAPAQESVLGSGQQRLRRLATQSLQKAMAASMSRRGRSQMVNAVAGEYETSVFFGTTAQLLGTAETCTVPPSNVTKHFDVTGQGAGEEGLLGYGGVPSGLVPGITGYDVMIPAGSYDWMALFGPAPMLPDFEHNWAAYRIGRDEDVPGGAVAIDRAGAPAFVPFPFTVSGGGGGSFWSFSQSFSGIDGAIAGFPIGPLLNMTGTGNLFFLQPGDRKVNDLVSFDWTNVEELAGGIQSIRTSSRYLGSAPPGSGAFTLNQAVPTFATSPVGGAPVTTWSTSGTIPTDYQGTESIVAASFLGAGDGATYSVVATRAWLAANGFTTTFTLSGQDLPGFQESWAPASPLDASTVLMFSSDFTTMPLAGSIFNLAIRSQTP